MARLFAGDSSGHLWEINPADPDDTTSPYGDLGASVASRIDGLTVHDGSLYAVARDSPDQLYLINPDDPDDTSGDFGLVGSLPSGLTDPAGMTSHDGNLYATGFTSDELFQINPANPSDTTSPYGEVGGAGNGGLPAGLTNPIGMASHDGNLYVVDTTGDELFQINPADPDDTTSPYGEVGGAGNGGLPAGLTNPGGMTSHDGNLYVVDASGDELFQINPANPSDTTSPYGEVGGAGNGTLPSGLTVPLALASLPDPAVAPSFTDSTGDAQTWTAGDAITSITVPEADGSPTPTYAVQSGLPAGLAFATTTRVISGTPTAAGSGTITVRATNSAGNADWTVGYTTSAALVAPSFTDNTGPAQSWTAGTSITAVTVPLANGNPAPAYSVIGTLPSGIAFNTTTRRITGTPTAAGSGTIRIRATNSQGTADWTVTYTTNAGLAAPSFSDPTGDSQTWTAGTSITNVTVPAASGNPTPTYAERNSVLPAGLSFNPTTRVLSGTPTSAGSGTVGITASNSQGSADWTFAYTTNSALGLSDFDATGLDVIVLGLITTGAQSSGTFYRSPLNGGPLGLLAAGSDMTITGDQVISRCAVFSGGSNFRIWDNPSLLSFSTIFPSGTPYKVYLQTTDGLAIFDRGDQGGNFSDWNSSDSAEQAIADSLLTTGTDFILAIAQPATALVAPSFTDSTGDAQTWTQDTAITSITVPEANANPAANYAAIGSLPAGLAFNTTTRVLSGTPTATGSGTITIQASNSQGNANWTVDYTTAASSGLSLSDFDTTNRTVDALALITANIDGDYLYRASQRGGSDTIDDGELGMGVGETLATALSWNGRDFLINDNDVPVALSLATHFGLSNTTSEWTVTIQTADGSASTDELFTVGDEFANFDFVSSPREIIDDIADGTPFIFAIWQAVTAPSFTDSTGDAQTWTAGDAITSITVPTAAGNPTPTYAVQSGLPAGLAFSTSTRVISGTPTATGSGTITIRATNSEGSADWTVAYTTSAAQTAPSFTDNTGPAQSWTQDTAIASLTVPAADGNPAPTYAVSGSLPAGIAFDTTSRVISGTPAAVGSGTITIRATNTEGTADWTVAYTVRAESSNATLLALTVTAGTLSPAFAPGTTDYTVSVDNSVASITIAATAANGTVAGTGAHALIVGANTLAIVVTAEDGTTTQTYTVIVTRAAPPLATDAALSSLSVSVGTLIPTFAAATTSYRVAVANTVTSLTVSATANDSNATVAGDGLQALNVGDNVVSVVVTAQDGVTTRTYTVTVARAAGLLSNDATLSSLTVSAGTLGPAFSASGTAYEVSVANSVAVIAIGATASDSNATIEGAVDIVVIAGRPLVHLIAPIDGVDYAVDEGSISHTEVTTVGVEGAAARITLIGDDAVVATLRLRGHILATGEAETRTGASSLAAHGRSASRRQFAEYLGQAEAGDLAADIIAYSDQPRDSWDTIIDGDRSTENMEVALESDIRDVQRVAIDHQFDKHGEIVRIQHRITEASGRLVTRLTMLDTRLVTVFDHLLLEDGDRLLLESNDNLRLEG